MSERPELLPCPFCGGKAEMLGMLVGCYECDVYPDFSDIVAEWNTRATLWQPIETAPKDGTVVLIFAATPYGLPSFQCTCAYHEDAGWCVDELREATHWMPLPDPPDNQ